MRLTCRRMFCYIEVFFLYRTARSIEIVRIRELSVFVCVLLTEQESFSVGGGLCDGSLCFPSYFSVNNVILLIFTVVGGCFSWYV